MKALPLEIRRTAYPSRGAFADCYLVRPILIALFCVAAIAACAAGATRAQTTNSRAAEIQSHFRKAAQYLQANDPQSAIKEYEAVLAIDPKNAEALTNRGALSYLRGDCKSASQDFRKALASDPSLAKATGMLGICENRTGGRAAKAHLETAFAKLTEKHLREQVGTELVGIYFQQGDDEHAAMVAQELVNIDPDNVDNLYMAQLVYSELADDTLNKLTILAPGSARMQQVIAEHLVNAGNLKEAIQHYKQCLELGPQLTGVRFELAEAILESAKNDPATEAAAQAELEKAARIEGDSAKIESEMGRIATLQSNNQTAYDHYTRALQMDPGEVSALVGMGHVLMALGKPAEALKYLSQAVQADPLNSEAHYRLGTVYRKLNMEADAAKELKLFQEIKKTDDQVKEIYGEMNKRPRFEQDQTPDDAPQQ